MPKATMPKAINRNFTQDQEVALATEVVDGEIWIEVRPLPYKPSAPPPP
jgi:hypothetical protein